MNLKSTALVSLLALGLMTGVASAATGVATGTVNVREGAGTQYDVIGHLTKGELIEIAACNTKWCLTEQGFVSAGYLAVVDYEPYLDDYEPHHHHHHDVDLIWDWY
jgi:uncharacterized protein YraI